MAQKKINYMHNIKEELVSVALDNIALVHGAATA